MSVFSMFSIGINSSASDAFFFHSGYSDKHIPASAKVFNRDFYLNYTKRIQYGGHTARCKYAKPQRKVRHQAKQQLSGSRVYRGFPLKSMHISTV